MSKDTFHEPVPPAQRNHKDTVFRMLFKDRRALLTLYNAVNGTHYENADDLEIVTLDNAIYMSMKNDVAFLINFQLHLYEHQSTVNPNMPLRFLHYISREYEKLVQSSLLYKRKSVQIPAPQFVVFYNGTTKQPERQVLTLSDLYTHKEIDPQLELKVIVLNINPEYNETILEHCQKLREYVQYVDCVRKYNKHMDISLAIAAAVDECIQKGILAEFLRANKAEVISMSIFEYDEEEVFAVLREEAWEDGLEIGLSRGRSLTLIEQVCRKLQKGKSPELIAEELDEEYGSIAPICQAATQIAPDYDPAKIYEMISGN